MSTMTEKECNKITSLPNKGVLALCLIISLGCLGLLISAHSEHKKQAAFRKAKYATMPLKTPPLLSIPRSQWPKEAKDALGSGESWGQCQYCNKVIKIGDVRVWGFCSDYCMRQHKIDLEINKIKNRLDNLEDDPTEIGISSPNPRD